MYHPYIYHYCQEYYNLHQMREKPERVKQTLILSLTSHREIMDINWATFQKMLMDNKVKGGAEALLGEVYGRGWEATEETRELKKIVYHMVHYRPDIKDLKGYM